MNIRKIKLALTVGLLNKEQQSNALQDIKDLMQGFTDEVGAFLNLSRLGQARLNPSHVKETYKIRFERCTLDVDLVLNPNTNTQIVQGFQVH